MIDKLVNEALKVCIVGLVLFGTNMNLFAQSDNLASVVDKLESDTSYLAPIHTQITNQLKSKVITNDSAAIYYSQLAELAKERHDFTLSRLLIGKSFNHLKSSENSPIVARLHILLGEMANEEDEISSALSLFSAALDIYKEEQDSINYLHTLRKIGVAYDYIGDHETALQYYDECIELAQILGREDVIGNCYNTIAAISKEEGNYNESIAYFEKGIEIAVRIQDKILLGKLYHNISLPYQHLELFDEANHYLSLSMNLAQEIQDIKGIGFAYQGFGFMYLRKGQYDSSEYYMRKALEVSHKINNMQLEGNAREVLGEIYEETGRYKEAFENLQILKAQDDSLFNQENAQIIESIKGKYQAAKKDQELAETTLRLKDADFELRRQSIVQIALMLVLSLTVVILFLIYRSFRMRQKANVMLVAKNAEIKRHVTQVEHLNQTKNRWFVNVAHELRTPLTLIRGPLTRVLSQFELQPEVKSDLELVNKNAISLSNLVNEILDLSRMEEGDVMLKESEFNLCETIDQIVQSFKSKALHQGLHLSSICELKINVKADKDKFAKVLSNLIGNAMKFTEPGGSVTVITSIKSHLEVKVKDTGIGINEEDLPYVFDRYYQASNGDAQMQGGTGIGLSLSKEIAILHGGDLNVKSRQGKGSSFVFELPMSRIVS